MNDRRASKGSQGPPCRTLGETEPANSNDDDGAVVSQSSSSNNTSNQEEPSTREIMAMLQVIKVDLDCIKNVLETSLVESDSTDGVRVLNIPNNNNENAKPPSPAELIRITEEWDDANPKVMPPCLGGTSAARLVMQNQAPTILGQRRYVMRIDGPTVNSSSSSTQSTPSRSFPALGDSAARLQMRNKTRRERRNVVLEKARAFVNSSSPPTPKASNTKHKQANVQNAVTDDSDLALPARGTRLHSVSSPSSPSGARLIAKHTGTTRVVPQPTTASRTSRVPQTNIPVSVAMDWINTVLSGATDRSLMALQQRIHDERRRRLNEATLAGAQDRIRILNSDGTSQSCSKKKKKKGKK